MAQYLTTVVQNRPEFIDKKLLLTCTDGSGLYVSDNNSNILLEFDRNGGLSVNEITDKFSIKPMINCSLRNLGLKYLGLDDPTVPAMLQHVVIPEMEVERIFNNLRYKYLEAVYLSNFADPSVYLHYHFNKSFQTLAGLTVYQGNTPDRLDNDLFWKREGFTDQAKNQNWEKEKSELQHIIRMLKLIKSDSNTELYKELIAIKPGFHEVLIHDKYFDFDAGNLNESDKPREKVFTMLRGGDTPLTLHAIPREIDWSHYISYAPCNVTEGPFVFRKSVGISYFDEIRKIDSDAKRPALKDKFHILDYSHGKVRTRGELKILLGKARTFTRFMTSHPQEA
jgi:hypothetical protein